MTSPPYYKIEVHMDSGLSAEVWPVIAVCEATTAADIPAGTDEHPELDIAAHFYLSRDKCRTVRLILKPHSIMILGGGRRWWPTAENRLASL